VLAEMSTELNWHTFLIKIFVTEKVVWRLKFCRIKPVLVEIPLNASTLLKMGSCSRSSIGSSSSSSGKR
jgi:hypothetical protein